MMLISCFPIIPKAHGDLFLFCCSKLFQQVQLLTILASHLIFGVKDFLGESHLPNASPIANQIN
jgi:hypothetical protein